MHDFVNRLKKMVEKYETTISQKIELMHYSMLACQHHVQTETINQGGKALKKVEPTQMRNKYREV